MFAPNGTAVTPESSNSAPRKSDSARMAFIRVGGRELIAEEKPKKEKKTKRKKSQRRNRSR